MPGPASRLAREISAETMSASSGSVNARRRNNRGTLEQVNEGDDSTDSRGEGEEESRSLTRRNDRVRTNSRLERGSVKSREISVRRGSVVSQRHEQSSTRPGAKYFCQLMPNIFIPNISDNIDNEQWGWAGLPPGQRSQDRRESPRHQSASTT